MSIERIQRDDVIASALGVLGLEGHDVDLFSIEGICAAVRRAASFLCPASPRQIVDAVLEVLRPLIPDVPRDTVNTALELLVGAGDLLELRAVGDRTRLLYLGPPSYVETRPGHYLILGVRPQARPIVDEQSLGAAVTYASHTRSVILDPDIANEALAEAGLHRLTREQWCRAPRPATAAAEIARAHQRFELSQTPGQISGLLLIDPAAPLRYYKGRWRSPASTDNGLFVGRRPQAYGADLWCAVELADGVAQQVLDLPTDSTVAPGWDEARRLQAALDAEHGNAQVFRARPTGDGDVIVDFFAPLPSWADRYLDLTATPVPKSQGALFSYRVSRGAEEGVTEFLSTTLWMQATEDLGEK